MDDGKHFPKSIGLRRRLGKYSIAILVGGTVLILGCVGFLVFLFWLGGDGNTAWRNIVVSGWAARSITITAFVLRAVTAAQAAVATSMVASLLLHSTQTRLASFAAVSVACFANTGPVDLVPHLHRRASWAIYLVVGSLVVTSAVLQLTSTLLLSGVGRGYITMTEHLANLNYGITTRSLFSVPRETVGYLVHGKGPTAFPAFAESSEPVDAAGTGDAIRDTGPSMRAFLPIPTQARREALFFYDGVATALDTRVVCMRPSVDGLRIFPPSAGHKINGTIWTDQKVRGQRGKEGTQPLKFSCPYALIDKRDRFSFDGSPQEAFAGWDEEWPVNLCSLELHNSSIRSDMRLLDDVYYPYLPMKLILHSTGPYSAWNTTGEINVTRLSGSNEWLVAETSQGSSLRMTLCTSDVVAQDMYIRATGGGRVPEPIPLWRADKAVYNVDRILTQLGVSSFPGGPTLAARGIFHMSSQQPLSATPNRDTNATGPALDSTFPQHTYVTQALADLSYYAGRGADTQESRGTLSMCVYCTDTKYGISLGSQLAPVPAAVFQGALRATNGNAALAMQALMTTALGLTYYDLTDRFDKGAPAEVRSFVEVDRPMHGAFAVVVVVLLVVHGLAVAAAVTGFALAGGENLLGSAWAAVAQVRRPEVDVWLEREEVVGKLRDSEIERRMAEAGQGSLLVKVDGVDGTQRLRRRR